MNQELMKFELFLFYLMLVAYILSMLFYWWWLASRREAVGRMAVVLAVSGFVGNTIAIGLRMIIAHRPPLANGYEFLLTFCWGIMVVFLVTRFRFRLKPLGAFVLPIPALLLLFVLIGMRPEERSAMAIAPALRSSWLTIHVVTAILAYGAFAVSFSLGIMYLLKQGRDSRDSLGGHGLLSRFPSEEAIDELAYKVVGFAFPLLTLCIITGAVWANYTWGTYWSWDPKETWSLITWIIYAGYLHARMTFAWKGRRAAKLAVLGFIAVLFTFFGVNYFLSGLHSYASM